MDLRVKVGQLFFVGFDGVADGPALRDYLGELRPGGLIHFARNIESVEQVAALNAALYDASKASGCPVPFISVDQEGGRVSRLRKILPALPSAAQLVPMGEARIRAYGRALGEALAVLGFNADFAPVVDLSSPGAANGIGDRSFGEDAAQVVRCARAFIAGLSDAGVVSWVKHFPGLGATELDSHIGLPVCAREPTEMWERDLLPFRECADDAAGVMIAHVHCPPFDPGAPVAASLSRAVVTGLLRSRMGYEGIALTDDLEMGAVAGPPPEELAIATLEAGSDMIMWCNSEAKARDAYRGVLDAVRSGRVPEARIDRSVERILAAKARFAIDASVARGSARAREAALTNLQEWATAGPAGRDPTGPRQA
jgi:beta-N-acetylhexosaminidase